MKAESVVAYVGLMSTTHIVTRGVHPDKSSANDLSEERNVRVYYIWCQRVFEHVRTYQ